MTFRRIAKTLGLGGVFALGLLTMFGSGTQTNQTPQTPSAAVLQIPGNSLGLWEDVSPLANGSYTVLPFVTAVPMVKVSFAALVGFSLHVTATDDSAGTPAVNIPEVTQSTNMQTGYYVDNIDTNQSPPRWQITIKLPPNFQTTSAFTIGISEMSSSAESAPLRFPLVGRSFQVGVIVNGGGHVTSSPKAISCAPTSGATDCDHTFASPATGVVMTVELYAQSYQTINFSGWSGACSAANSNSGTTGSTCTLTLDGTRKVTASASFGGSATTPALPCPLITYPHFRGTGNMPQCQPAVGAKFAASCDSGGFFSCPSGAPFCDTFNNLLKQPGGCYEVDPSDPP